MANSPTLTPPEQEVPTSATIPPEVVAQHGLTPDEYQKITRTLGRQPSLTELGIFSVMWSEHCSYKSSRVHLKRLPTRSPRVVQGPGENAGIIDIGDGWACAFKIESHNHPSFLEPFQGAATGVGGILRDIFTMGARPIAVMDSLRFGPIQRPRPDASPADEKAIHRNHSLLEGVVSGIASYGNCFGVPNLGGETKFELCYSGNPLVNAFALGIVRREHIFYARAAGVGNPVIYVGAKTGRDGIHGATMASEEFREGSEQKRPNVQVGDPFLEKLLLEACLEAMQTGAIVGIQDMGAAGLTCSTCEMGARGGVGIEIEMQRVPQRETGMTPYEIMLSESQERMLLVAEKGREDQVFRVFEKWGLDAFTIGHVTSDGVLRVRNHGELAAEIPNTALADEAPLYHRPMERWDADVAREMPAYVSLGAKRDLTADLKRLLSSPNICSKRWITEQYDSMVQTNTLEGPGADAGLVRIKGTSRALAMSLDGNGRWCYLDPKLGASHAVAEAARNVACTGAVPLAATNCLNFGNPEKPQVMWQFSQVIDGLARACEALGTPITGGNVSLYNETLGEGIYPTPVVGVVGVLEDAARAVQPRFRGIGREIILLRASEPGDPTDAGAEFGSSEYAKEVLGELWGYPPALELEREAALHKCMARLAAGGLIESAHDCSEGGLAVALAESCFSKEGRIGANVALDAENGLGPEFLLFGEDASRIVISCDPEHLPAIKKVAQEHGVAAVSLGKSVPEQFTIAINGATVISRAVSELEDAWVHALERMLHVETEERLVPNVVQKS
ncbi:MAG TPA: phosphoribosylformylglycinamidine synthase subunit PurL [Terriglobales bacterium]|nr:phosphoribosylformylglycinamidine synthase subunit PurL [Terriglobales bacterium]